MLVSDLHLTQSSGVIPAGNWFFIVWINRGYDMAVDIRNFSSLSFSLLFRIFSWNIFQHSKINLVSLNGHPYVMFYYYINTNKKPNHFNEIENNFTAIYYVVKATVIFLHERITCHSHVWVCHVLARKLTPGISMLYKRRVFSKVNKMSLTAVTHPRLMLQSAVPNSYK